MTRSVVSRPSTEAWLATLPATPKQRWSAIAIGVVLLVGFGVFAPLADRPLPRFDAFIPSFEAIVFVTDFITSVLLFAHFFDLRFTRTFGTCERLSFYGASVSA